MKKTWKTAGIIALSAGILAYPAILLYRFIAKKMEKEDKESHEGGAETIKVKKLFPAYRGKAKPHHRHNGQ